jgi:hypothetical protein
MLHDKIEQLLAGQIDVLTVEPTGQLRSGPPAPGAILSGAFNPLHIGHTELAQAAASLVGREPRYELAVVNADKGAIPVAEIVRRVGQFGGQWLMLSREPLFTSKAALYPGSYFVLGYDTAVRLLDPRYYGGPAGLAQSLQAIAEHSCRFIVAGRLVEGRFQTLADLTLPAGFSDLFIELPEKLFRADISSSAIRTRR